MKIELLVVLAFIILLIGLPYTLLYLNPLTVLGTTIIVIIYIIGSLGLMTICNSIYAYQKKQSLVLFSGALLLLIAYFSLEVLLRR